LVWVNTSSHVYHMEGSRWYGKTRHGKYMSEEDAISEGDHAAPGKSKWGGRGNVTVSGLKGGYLVSVP